MKKIERTIQLETNDPEAQLSLYCSYLEQHSFTFRVSVVSGPFRGADSFCVLDSFLESFVSSLREMHATLRGDATLIGTDSDGVLEFKMQENGHVSVAGQIGSSWCPTSLRFEFITDQTCLLAFSDALNNCLSQRDGDQASNGIQASTDGAPES